ncbi:MAG: CBS domain-containing protein [Bacilli bacterium]|nr:CBS domain-containing protein [Bacilli bacterium]MDD4077124.1 CBS domain-containing protein [Bacilli bacterium]
MKIKTLMTKKVITAKKQDRISHIAMLMANYDIGMVVIINDNREVLGVVTDRDIVIRALSQGRFEDAPVETIMTQHCIDIDKNETAIRAMEMMGEYQVRRLVITNDDKKLVGIVSLADLALVKNTNKLINEILYEISIPNPQKEKPLKYLEVEDYPL